MGWLGSAYFQNCILNRATWRWYLINKCNFASKANFAGIGHIFNDLRLTDHIKRER